jgi:hypothetical protein
MWHDGTGFEFCASDVAFMQVTAAGPVIAAVAGCETPVSTVACIDCTLPRRDLCALPVYAVANIATASTATNVIRRFIFLTIVMAHLSLAVDCTPVRTKNHKWDGCLCRAN